MKKGIRIAIVGIGNCASALIQGIHYYRKKKSPESAGLMHWSLGGYLPSDISVSAAFDIDVRKVGKDVNEAVFSDPNCTTVFQENIPPLDVKVRMGPILDGVSEHLSDYPEKKRFVPAERQPLNKSEIVDILKRTQTHVLLNYLPVGSEEASRFYAQCALEAKVAFVNNIPVFIASDPVWAQKFEKQGIPLLGDDIKSQIGATIIHRTLTDLFNKRGVKLKRTYQLNTGGNTDFLNMLNRSRLASKKESKTEAVQSVAGKRILDENIHIGPSDYVPWQKDNKICFIRMEGTIFGDIPIHLDLRLSVEDSPNSAGVAIDAIRCAKLALDRGEGGVIEAPSAYFFKHPPQQYPDYIAYQLTESFIAPQSSEKKHDLSA